MAVDAVLVGGATGHTAGKVPEHGVPLQEAVPFGDGDGKGETAGGGAGQGRDRQGEAGQGG